MAQRDKQGPWTKGRTKHQARRTKTGIYRPASNTTRPPSAYDSFCVTAPTAAGAVSGYTLPNAGQQICGFMDLNPSFSTTVPFYLVQKASNFGDVSDVYSGYDVNLNARLPRGGLASGGVSVGHEVTDICAIAGQASATYATVAGVLASSSGTLQQATAGYNSTSAGFTPSTLYCHVEPPFQADVKGLVSYPLPWWGLTTSATIQNRPGPQTSRPNVTRAGAWTGTGWPPTMEGAVRSGVAAAKALTSARQEVAA